MITTKGWGKSRAT